MSKYTTELRYLLEAGYNLGLSDYPIFDEAYRAGLNQKILNHYKFREIGFETAALFKHFLNTRMNEIMPYYNQLYLSEKIKIEPLLNRKFDETYTRNNTNENTQNIQSNSSLTSDGTENRNGTSTTAATDKRTGTDNATVDETRNGSTTQGEKRVESDTPQGLLSINNIEAELYASKAAIENDTQTTTNTDKTTTNRTTGDDLTHNSSTEDASQAISHAQTDGTNTSDSTAKGTGWENFTRNLNGFEGETQSEMLLKFRTTFLNIDLQVIEELNDLFLNLY